MNLIFPTNPTIGDTYQKDDSPLYYFDGEHWTIQYATLPVNGTSGTSGMAGADGTSGSSGANGTSGIQKHWVAGDNITVNSGDVVKIGSDYVLIDSDLYTQGPDSDGYGSSVTIAGKTYNRDGKLVISGDFVVYDSYVSNDGEIQVDGGLILEGDSTIIGDGIII